MFKQNQHNHEKHNKFSLELQYTWGYFTYVNIKGAEFCFVLFLIIA